jgi:hypothetical protein
LRTHPRQVPARRRGWPSAILSEFLQCRRLREAVIEYRALPKPQPGQYRALAVFRGSDKEPFILEEEHLEELAQLPEFQLHLRTTNPIESTFATVRHRTIRSKGCLSNKTALAMVFKLVEAAQKAGGACAA